jgi:hypothetical protein
MSGPWRDRVFVPSGSRMAISLVVCATLLAA